MTQFVNVPSFAGTAGVGIATSDANWEVNYQAGSTSAVVSDAARARQNEGTEVYYSRTETPPGLTQVVSSTIRRFTAVTGSNVGVYARAYAPRSCIVAQLRTESGGAEVRLYKLKGGTATQLGSSVSVTTTNGADHVLLMEVSGTAPIAVNVKFGGTSIIDTTFTDADFNVAGKVGIRFGYGTGLATNSTGLHIASFTADDTISGGGAVITPASGRADATGYAPTVVRGDAQAVAPTGGRASVTGYAPTVAASADLTTSILMNNTATPHASAPVAWSWFPSGRVGALDAVTPVDGTGTTDASGQLTVSGLVPPGVLLVAVLNTDAADDDVYYEAFA